MTTNTISTTATTNGTLTLPPAIRVTIPAIAPVSTAAKKP